MERSKEIFAIMREEEFNSLTPDFRSKLLSIEVREASEWLNNREDANYIKLYKAQQNAKKMLQTYLFEKRNNKKNK